MSHVNATDVAPDGAVRNLVDRDILARTTGYSVATIRKWCTPDHYDVDNDGRAVYDRDRAIEQLKAAGVEPRPATRGPRSRNAPRRRNP